MNKPDTDIDIQKANHILRPPHSTGTKGMSQASRGSVTMMATRRGVAVSFAERGSKTALGAADWLRLAAAPTFAIMALLTGVLGGPPDILCLAMHDTSPLGGMVPMYLLMSIFHSTPWLKLVFGRRGVGVG